MPLPRKFAAAAALVVALVVSLAATASAHVSVNPREATRGGFTKLTFRVPNEQSTAATTKVEVQFPADHPLASVSVKPVPGWTADVATMPLTTPITSDDGQITQAVSTITWSGGSIKPGEFQEFDVSVGPLPSDTDSLVFKAVQTYDNGDVVRWIETSTPGGPEPTHPAPVLTLVKATAGDQASGGAATDDQAGDGAAVSAADVPKQSDVAQAGTLAIVGIALGGLGVLGAAAALLTRRRPAA